MKRLRERNAEATTRPKSRTITRFVRVSRVERNRGGGGTSVRDGEGVEEEEEDDDTDACVEPFVVVKFDVDICLTVYEWNRDDRDDCNNECLLTSKVDEPMCEGVRIERISEDGTDGIVTGRMRRVRLVVMMQR